MKKLIMLSVSFLMVMFFATSNAQDMKNVALASVKNSEKKVSNMEMREIRNGEERNDVSVYSKDAFAANFGAISNVRWKGDQYYDIAIFSKKGKQYNAFFNRYNSNFIGTASNAAFADLPKHSQKEIKKEYKNFTIDKVIYYEDNEHTFEDMLLYGVKFASADNYFAELSNKKKNKNIVLQITPDGQVLFFKDLHSKV